MEDDNGLELSLGLRCGGSSAKSKSKVGTSPDSKIDEGDKGNKMADDFRNFFQAGNESQKNEPVKPQENFFNNLVKAGEAEEEDKRSEINNKRKMLFDEMNLSKKLDKESNHGGYEKARASHISIMTEEGSTAENEDVADSEVDGSTSRLGGLTYGGSNTVQPMHVPYSLAGKDSNSVGATGYPLTRMLPVTPPVNGEQNSSNLPQAFGYPPVQLPAQDKNNFLGLASQSQQFHPQYIGRGAAGVATNSVKPNDRLKLSQVPNVSESLLYGERGSEPAKGDNKIQTKEDGSASQKDDNMKKNTINNKASDQSEQLRTEVIRQGGSSIRPGAKADLKFGGSGSVPNLPWVSTTVPGPNGRTISGVTYRFSENQIRIVCACHGSHMSPDEFIRHASEDHPNQDNGNSVAGLPNGNPAASAQT